MSNSIGKSVRYGVAAAAILLGGCASAAPMPATETAQASMPGQAQPDRAATDPVWFFPDIDWTQYTAGGRGGEVVRVTTLDSHGPGSLREALAMDVPRIIVFEVGGVIDLQKETLAIANPHVTIAGQTAPSPGITLIRGGMNISTHDVIVQHIRIRPGDNNEARGSGWDDDSINTTRARNVIVDHCTLTWATDENLSSSGPRFTGETPDDWRAGTSHNVLFSHNLIAEGLADSTHAKFEHSKGSLIHDNVNGLLIYANLYAHNYERSPLFKGGVHGQIVNNFIYDPGQRAVHYNLQALEWGDVPFETGKMDLIGNTMRAGQSTPDGLPLVMLGGDGDLAVYAEDNIAVDRWGNPLPERGRYTTGRAEFIDAPEPMPLPQGLPVMPARDVERYVLANAGARPWDRDSQDVRVLANAAEGRGDIIDSQEQVGGYPRFDPTYRSFDPSLWDMETMLPLSPEALDASARGRGT